MLGRVQIGRNGNVLGQDITIKLSDIAGVGRFTVKDADGATVFSVDSQGTVRARGQYQKV